MARRGRKPRRAVVWRSHKETVLSAVSLFLILAGIIFLISIFAGMSGGGTLTGKIRNIIVGSLGLPSSLFSLFLVYSGLLVIGTLRWKILSKRIFLGLVLFQIGLLGLFNEAGGKAGVFLRSFLASLITMPGAWITFFILSIFSIVLITGVGIRTFFEKLYAAFDFVKVKVLKTGLPDEEDGDGNAEQKLLGDAGGGELEKSRGFEGGAVVAEGAYEDVPATAVSDQRPDLEIIAPPSGPIKSEAELFGGSGGTLLDEHDRETPLSAGSSDSAEGDSLEDEERTSVSRLPFSNKVWEYPSIGLLANTPNQTADAGNVPERAKSIEETLRAFGIKATIANHHVGPAVTRYDLDLSIGTKASKVQSISTDLALRLKSPTGSVRVVAPIPGTNLVGVEVPNFTPSTVSLKSVLESDEMKKNKSKLAVAIGHNVEGEPVVQNISRWPHALVAGATGSGKSVMLNAIIATLLYRCSPSECRFIMIDPKMVELSQYNGIPHLLTPVVTDVEQKAVSVLAWAVAEMDRRYKLFAGAGVRNLEAYNHLSGFQAEPYIIIVIDEIADMMMIAASDVERYVTRLAQKSRATGIHLILSTQRPSVNILTGTIKANIPTRIAFKVTSQVDSRVIIDQSGAETLIGRGDMLFVPPEDSKARRIQGVFVSDKEIHDLVEFLKNTGIEPDYKEEIVKQKVSSNVSSKSIEGVDDKFKEAIKLVISTGKASTSFIQRKVGVGYSRAARMIDDMESAGIIGQGRGSKPREVLIAGLDEALARLAGKESEEE